MIGNENDRERIVCEKSVGQKKRSTVRLQYWSEEGGLGFQLAHIFHLAGSGGGAQAHRPHHEHRRDYDPR